MIGPKVHVHAADAGGCGMNRLIWPGRALQAAGFDVTVFEGDLTGKLQVGWRNIGEGGRPVPVEVVKPPCDVIVFQRPLAENTVALIPMLQAHGVAVVVEIDDAFEVMDHRNVGYPSANPQTSPRRNWDHLKRACAAADVVTCTTPALLERYGRHNGVVIPNYVPESYLDIPKPVHDGPPIVGWTGSIETHPDDLKVMGGAIADLCLRDVIQFRTVGTGWQVAEQLGLDDRYERWRSYYLADEVEAWKKNPDDDPPKARQVIPWWATGWLPLDDYPSAVAQFDVGLVPLQLTAFNEAKSPLKGLEYAATASPLVASPTGPYSVLSEEVPHAVTATKPKHWRGLIAYLAENAAELGEQNRAHLRAHDLTYEARAGQWAAAWMLAANRRAAIHRAEFIPADERKLLA